MSTLLLGKRSRVNSTGPATVMRVQTSLNGVPIPIVYGQTRLAPNLIDYTDFRAKQSKSSGAGGKGGAVSGGKGGEGTTYTYSATIDCALCEGPVANILAAWNNKTKQTLSSLNITAFTGSYSQSPWSYMASLHPDHALNYRGIAHFAAGPMQLGTSPELSNLTVEVLSTIANAIPGLPDADPAAVVADLLTNPHYGVGLPQANVGALSTYSAYCKATGLVVSMVVSDQTSGAEVLRNLAEATNSELRWSSGVLDVVPYGDRTVTGHGSTYTPPTAPEYDIDDDDLLPLSGSPNPIRISRKSPADQYNIVTVNFLNRDNDYNPDTRTATNDAAVSVHGPVKEDAKDWKVFANADAAAMAAQLRLGRLEVKNTYQFRVGRRFIRLDPMDLVALTYEPLGLDDQWVRITRIAEQSDGTLLMDAEQYLAGTGAAPIYGHQANSGHLPAYNVSPGNVNPPVVFTAPIQIAATGLEVWCAVSGLGNWGGCDVWVSLEAEGTYKNIGRIVGQCRQGTLSADLLAGADPDTTHTLSVDLSESAGTLAAGTTNDADSLGTLCYVDGEFLAYRDAALTSAHRYDLSYLRRGAYGSAASAHLSGTQFARLDEQIFKIPFSKDRVGQTLYLKFASFNLWGEASQQLSECTTYNIVLGGPPTVYAPSGLTTTPGLRAVKLTWSNPPNVGIEAIEIWRSTTGSFANAVHIDDAAGNATFYSDEGLTPGTTYWYWIRARDRAGGTGPFDPSSAGAGASAITLQVQGQDLSFTLSTDIAQMLAQMKNTIRQTQQTLTDIGFGTKVDLDKLTGPGSDIARRLSTLEATVAGNDLTLVSQAFLAINTSIDSINGTLAAQATILASLQSALTGYTGASAVSNAFSALNTTVTAQGNTITTQGNSITALQSALSGYTSANAVSNAFSSLNSTVTSQGNTITSQGNSITALQSALSGYTAANAVSNAFSSLNSTVTSQGNTITSQGNSITALQSALSGYTDANAVSNAFSSLNSTVTSQGNTITSQGNSITALQSALSGYTGANAVSNAFSSLNTTVTNQGNAISANASAITSVQAQANDATANALLRMSAVTAPGGVDARIAIQVRSSTGSSYSEAGIYMDALSGGGSRIALVANQILLDGTVLTSGAIQTGMIGSGQVRSGNIGSGQVGTSHIVDGAATNHEHVTATAISQSSGQLNTWTDLAVVSVSTSGKPVEIVALAVMNNADTGSHNISVRIYRDDVGVVWPANHEAKVPISNSTSALYPAIWVETPGSGSYTYRFQWKTDSTALTAYNPVMTVDELLK